jgi:O-antigen/teichoic acid export membrane protein
MSLGKKALSGFIWTLSSNLSLKFTSLFVNIVLARLLVPRDFGLVALLYIFFDISKTFIESGFRQALIREQTISEEDKSTTFYVNGIISVIAISIIWIAAPYISEFYNEPELTSLARWMSISLLFGSLGIVQVAVLTHSLSFKLLSYVEVGTSVLTGLGAIIVAYLGYGVYAIVARYILISLLTTLFLFYLNPWYPKLFIIKESFNRIFGFGSNLLISNMLNTIFQHLYKISIGKFFSATILGFYSQASMLNDTASKSLLATLQKVTYPILSKANDNAEHLQQVYRKLIQATTFAFFPIMMLLGVLAEPIVVALFGVKWLESAEYLQIITISGAFFHLHGININLLKVLGRSDLFIKLSLIKKIASVIILVITIPMGIKVMLYGMVLGSFISLYINTYYTKLLIDYGYWDQIMDILPIAVLLLPSIIISYSINLIFSEHPAVLLIIAIILSLISYIMVAFFSKSKAFSIILSLIESKLPIAKKLHKAMK